MVEGTHDIQNVTVKYFGPGKIRVAGDFISGSLAIGILVIVYSPSNGTTIQYRFIPRSATFIPMTVLSGLPSGHFTATVFVVEDNGLPFNRSATAPINISVCEGMHSYVYNVY